MSSTHLMVVLIVAMAMIASIIRARYSHSHKSGRARDENEARIGSDETERLRAEVKQLKDRLAVLERITVEKENSLEREIEQLRDRPLVERRD